MRSIDEIQEAVDKATERAKDYVTIRRGEYEELLQAQRKLDALEASGVDNWEGYDEAMSELGDEE